MTTGILRRAANALMRPQIRDFVYLKALRIGETELIAGAKVAARSVQTAMHAALQDQDDGPLDALLKSGSLAAPLHASLSDEVRRGRAEGDHVLELMLTELEHQRNAVSEGHPTIGRMLLVAGMQRAMAEANGLAGYHRMHLGEHLLVLDQQDQGLWRYQKQRELLAARGACVQVEVFFDDPTSSQSYVFEANVGGDALAASDEPDFEPQFLVADLNALTGGDFWSATSRVPTFMDPTDPRNPP